MNVSKSSQAIILLTCYFTKANDSEHKPLTPIEWGRFAKWLHENQHKPEDLLTCKVKDILIKWQDPKISSNRLLYLLGRGHSMALNLEKWSRSGLWVITRADSEYPWRLKQRLKQDAPPVLFGCGSKELLNLTGLAVVGSRNASEKDLNYAEIIGSKASLEGIAIVSGGAKGIDESAMLGAINNQGVTIGVMADNLLKQTTSKKWRSALMNGQAVLISPFYPEAGFSTGNAMARNKYIYCLADSSLVVHSGLKGGTLTGAQENIKKGWVPIYIKENEGCESANKNLINQGGIPVTNTIDRLKISDFFKLDLIIDPLTFSNIESSQIDMFSPSPSPSPSDFTNTFNFYNYFLSFLHQEASKEFSLEEIIKLSELQKSQVTIWLKLAISEGKIEKLNKPVRYKII
ncbi:MAG: DNA-processing protein DprA [Pseudomonadota bacterium]|nr:DNA-processing protein DprA [Pseudomonadota bacterium]